MPLQEPSSEPGPETANVTFAPAKLATVPEASRMATVIMAVSTPPARSAPSGPLPGHVRVAASFTGAPALCEEKVPTTTPLAL